MKISLHQVIIPSRTLSANPILVSMTGTEMEILLAAASKHGMSPYIAAVFIQTPLRDAFHPKLHVALVMRVTLHTSQLASSFV